MSVPHFEVASGVIDGVNTVFTVSLAYQPGTLAVFLNGQLLRVNGWSELGGARFELQIPPVLGDYVQAFFLDTLPAQPGEEVTPLVGVLDPLDEVLGVFAEVLPLFASDFDEVQPLQGTLTT